MFFFANQLIAATSRKGCSQSSHLEMRGGDMERIEDNKCIETIHMLPPDANAPIALDLTTLVISGTCITALLGLFLLFAWAQERIRALAWWGTAYLLGGFSVAVWSIENLISPPLPFGTANAVLFLACGMIWSAARIFHGRPVLWGAMAAGAVIWLPSSGASVASPCCGDGRRSSCRCCTVRSF
jgi:hypothetical protein